MTKLYYPRKKFLLKGMYPQLPPEVARGVVEYSSVRNSPNFFSRQRTFGMNKSGKFSFDIKFKTIASSEKH